MEKEHRAMTFKLKRVRNVVDTLMEDLEDRVLESKILFLIPLRLLGNRNLPERKLSAYP